MVTAVATTQDPLTHFAFPFRYDPDTGYATVTQGTDEERLQNVEVLFSTTRGERIDVPGYGVPDPTFSVQLDRTELERAVDEWVPEALAAVEDQPDDVDELIRQVVVRVQERAARG